MKSKRNFFGVMYIARLIIFVTLIGLTGSMISKVELMIPPLVMIGKEVQIYPILSPNVLEMGRENFTMAWLKDGQIIIQCHWNSQGEYWELGNVTGVNVEDSITSCFGPLLKNVTKESSGRYTFHLMRNGMHTYEGSADMMVGNFKPIIEVSKTNLKSYEMLTMKCIASPNVPREKLGGIFFYFDGEPLTEGKITEDISTRKVVEVLMTDENIFDETIKHKIKCNMEVGSLNISSQVVDVTVSNGKHSIFRTHQTYMLLCTILLTLR